MTQPKSFELGLVMAGAISAGAYTAGVVDFLLQAQLVAGQLLNLLHQLDLVFTG